MNVQSRIRLEQAIRAREAADDRLRKAVIDVIGDGPLRPVAAAWGITEGSLAPWRAGKGTPSLRLARAVLKRAFSKKQEGDSTTAH